MKPYIICHMLSSVDGKDSRSTSDPVLDFAGQQAVLRLKRHGNLHAHCLGRRDYELKLAPREVR
jgi:hypothetical protein